MEVILYSRNTINGLVLPQVTQQLGRVSRWQGESAFDDGQVEVGSVKTWAFQKHRVAEENNHLNKRFCARTAQVNHRILELTIFALGLSDGTFGDSANTLHESTVCLNVVAPCSKTQTRLRKRS